MPNTRQTTIKVIADRAGVSLTTVSRVLSGMAKKYRISQATEERVRQIAKELNYKPNQIARALRLKYTNTIGMIIPDISNPFFSSIARSVENESRKAGYSVIICDSQEDTELEKNSIKILGMRQVDGLIICPVGKESKGIADLVGQGVSVVTVDRYFPELNISSVVSDNFNGSMQAVDHFCRLGHKKIAFIQGIPDSSVNKERIRGYKEGLRSKNIPINDSYIVGDNFGEQNGYIGTKILLSCHDRPTAIFATSNLISLGAMRAITEENLRIPDDISIVAFDDQPYSDFLPTPMTTIRQKKEELGKLAINVLLNKIAGLKDKKRIVIPTELVVRNSVKKLI